jgi:hypothetical protein
MARCSCAGNSCGCLVQAGAGLVVEGQGTTSAPYIISMGGTSDAIIQDAAGPLDLTGVGASSVTLVVVAAEITDVLLPDDGVHLDVILQQDATGNHAVNWPDSIQWPGGTEPAETLTPNASDWYTLVQAGTIWFGNRVANLT